MMNVVALVMLLSSLGSAIVLSPEPLLVKSTSEEGGEGAVQAVKEAAQGTFQKAEEMVVEGVTKPLETGFGWFRRKPPPTPEDRLNAAREKAAEAKEAFQEASAQLKEAAVGKAGDVVHETGTYVGDKTSQAVGTVKGAAGTAEEWVEDGAHAMYDKAVDVKDGSYDAAAAVKDKTISKTKEGVEDTYESAAEALSSAKDKTYSKLGDEKQKVSLLAENAHDVVVDNLQLGLDKTKTTATDAAEKAKEMAEIAALETKETTQGIFGKVKDAACYTADCIRSRAQEAGSFLPHVGQGVGYVYNNNNDAGDTPAAAGGYLKERATDTVSEISEKAKEGARDAKDTAGRYYQEGRDMYDSGRGTAREYYDDAGRRYRRARDYYDHGPSDSYNYRGRNSGRNRYTGTRDPNSRYYEEEEDFYDHGFKDRARYAYRNARDRAGEYYDDVKGYLTPGNRRDHYYSSSRRTARDDNNHRGEDFDHDLVPELVEVVESMGWIRVGKVPKGYVSTASAKEVVIGDVKFVLPQSGKAAGHQQQQQPSSDETVIQHVTNSVKGAAQNVGEKLGLVKEKAREAAENRAENVRDGAGRVKDQVYETFRDGRSLSGRPFHQGRYEGNDGEQSEDDDSLLTKGVRNLKDGVRNAGHAYEQERSKAGEYADNARRELSSFAGYHGEDHGSDRNLSRHSRMWSWKDVFTRKPVGLLLALARALHLFTFSTVYGSAFWVTFVSGMILSKHVPRQQFGYVQSRMFPVYLRVLAVGQGVVLLLQLLMHPWGSADRGERVEVLNFVLMIGATLINAYVVEPKATKVMFERLKVEKEEGRGLDNAANPLDAKQMVDDQKKKLHAINQQFKSLHGYSSALNLISLGGLTCHVWHLANRLVV